MSETDEIVAAAVLGKIINSDEARRLRQEIDAAIANYARLFERRGFDVRIIGDKDYLQVHERIVYEIAATVVAG